MSFDQLSSAISSLGPSLWDHLWQSTIFAAGLVLIALVMRKNYARTRYWIWLAASVKFVIPFSMLVAFGSAFMPHRQPPRAVAAVYEIIDVVGQPFTAASASGTPIALSTPAAHAGLAWTSIIPLCIALIWALGTLSVLTMWGAYWWKVKAAIRRAPRAVDGPELQALCELQAAGLGRANIALYLSETNLGPGVYGISHPVLIWPARVSQSLNDAQIKSILAHELCHIERRDNLTACVHMLVEATFWFHPLVWWLGSHLELERERACDEHVLQFMKAPRTYAESILKVCEMCLESPLECVSGVTGANLKERIRRIMTSHMGQQLTLSRKVLLVAVAFSSIAVPIIFGQVANGHISQNPTQPLVPKQGFEVATIKPVENGPKTPRFIKFEGTNRFIVRDYNLKLLIAAAYNMNPKTISGGPDWIESDHYDILALTPGQTRPSRDEQMAMLRKLLEDRFKLTFHREQKEFSIYALEIAKDGPKLKNTTLNPTDPTTVGPGMVYPQKIVMPARNATMNDFASLLQRAVLDRPVVDMTGLTGRYDFSLEWAPDESQFGGELPPASADAPSPPLFEAIQQQLGLRLEARKGPVSAIVIDQVEHPSPN